MPSSQETPTKYSRRIKWLGIAVLVFIAFYTGAWFWGASFVKGEVGKALAAQSANGQVTDCQNLDIKGYPFRAGLFCDSLTFEDPAQQIALIRFAISGLEPQPMECFFKETHIRSYDLCGQLADG